MVAPTYTIITDIDKDQTSGQDYNNQDNIDLQPFDPDYQEAAPQKLIANLPKLNECEFDHNYRSSRATRGRSHTMLKMFYSQ